MAVYQRLLFLRSGRSFHPSTGYQEFNALLQLRAVGWHPLAVINPRLDQIVVDELHPLERVEAGDAPLSDLDDMAARLGEPVEHPHRHGHLDHAFAAGRVVLVAHLGLLEIPAESTDRVSQFLKLAFDIEQLLAKLR